MDLQRVRVSDVKAYIDTTNANSVFNTVCKLGRLRLVKHIVHHYAWVNLDLGLKTAAKYGHLKIVKFLHSRDAKTSPLSDFDIVTHGLHGEMLICRYRRMIHYDETKSYNALAHAIIQGHLDVVQYLHTKGATCPYDIQLAAKNGHLAMVQYLYSQATKLYAQQALQFAAQNGHLEVVRFLHAQGVDIGANDNYAVRWAAQNGHLEVVRFLYSEGADTSRAKSRNSDVSRYLRQKIWLQTSVSELRGLAARCYAKHYTLLPAADTVPDVITEILSAAMA